MVLESNMDMILSFLNTKNVRICLFEVLVRSPNIGHHI